MLISHGLSNARLRIREHIDYSAARMHATAKFLRTLGFVSCPVIHTVWLHDLLGGRTSTRNPVRWCYTATYNSDSWTLVSTLVLGFLILLPFVLMSLRGQIPDPTAEPAPEPVPLWEGIRDEDIPTFETVGDVPEHMKSGRQRP